VMMNIAIEIWNFISLPFFVYTYNLYPTTDKVKHILGVFYNSRITV
jgi:hypothetical protein